MELPKHTTQVGTIGANKKLYLEDYCISYMKQLGEQYPGERKQIALFGIVEREKNTEYGLAYGAALLGRGKGRTDSLTVTQKEEAENFRQEFFQEYQLLGVVIATDSIDENIYWLGNGTKTIPLDGYYIFYDKNEVMLNFMMQNQKEEREIDLDPVIIKKADMDREKREKKEKEAEELARLEAEKKSGSYREKMKKTERSPHREKLGKKAVFPAAACLLLAATAGVYGVKQLYPQTPILQPVSSYVSELWDKAAVFTGGYLDNDLGDKTDDIQLVKGSEESQQGDASAETKNGDPKTDIPVVSTQVQAPAELDVIIIPEELGKENKEDEDSAGQSENDQNNTEQNEGQQEPSASGTQEVSADNSGDNSCKYLIQKGDSLLRILRNHYGDDSRLSEVCDVNGIADPNNIQVGQTILLP